VRWRAAEFELGESLAVARINASAHWWITSLVAFSFNAKDAKVDAEDAEQWLLWDFGDYLCDLCENLRALCV
jgi:hypothetical protein